jgi:hypothetical protein
VRIAAGLASQLLALLGKALLQADARAPGAADHLVTRDLQQAAVHRVRDGLLLDRGVDDHALERLGFDGLHRHRRIDGGLEQLLQPFFADVSAKAADLSGVAG